MGLGQGLDEEMQDLINNLHNTCVGEVGVDEGLITKAQNGDFAEDEKLMCYSKCLLDQMAIVDEEGVVDPEAALAVLPADMQAEAGPAVRKCSKLRGSNPCNTVFEVMKCWYKESPATYFMP
ncbi:general odorant-binding protein 83a-like isoform X2 [Coccinella septempunctata]|uniref:general odorant-binding protein 83a-like isoform X2 n=1 Tax=Coccinella septempunctata TaxID=41139 RepID=UPI001D088279|nr:general odorant-binding protein 83a-like isoform X2 [Coccinella septempunctata]